MTSAPKGFRAWLKRMRLNVRHHPASPYAARALGYGLVLVLVLVVAVALKDSPLRGYSAIVAVCVAVFVARKMMRALKHGRQIIREEAPEQEGVFRRMTSAIKQAKKL